MAARRPVKIGMTSTKGAIHRVLAGNRAEFAEYVKTFEVNPNNVRYITSSAQIVNLPRGTTISLVGNFRDNKIFREVYEVVIQRDFRIVEVQFK
jgi:hypothetical protein